MSSEGVASISMLSLRNWVGSRNSVSKPQGPKHDERPLVRTEKVLFEDKSQSSPLNGQQTSTQNASQRTAQSAEAHICGNNCPHHEHHSQPHEATHDHQPPGTADAVRPFQPDHGNQPHTCGDCHGHSHGHSHATSAEAGKPMHQGQDSRGHVCNGCCELPEHHHVHNGDHTHGRSPVSDVMGHAHHDHNSHGHICGAGCHHSHHHHSHDGEHGHHHSHAHTSEVAHSHQQGHGGHICGAGCDHGTVISDVRVQDVFSKIDVPMLPVSGESIWDAFKPSPQFRDTVQPLTVHLVQSPEDASFTGVQPLAESSQGPTPQGEVETSQIRSKGLSPTRGIETRANAASDTPAAVMAKAIDAAQAGDIRPLEMVLEKAIQRQTDTGQSRPLKQVFQQLVSLASEGKTVALGGAIKAVDSLSGSPQAPLLLAETAVEGSVKGAMTPLRLVIEQSVDRQGNLSPRLAHVVTASVAKAASGKSDALVFLLDHVAHAQTAKGDLPGLTQVLTQVMSALPDKGGALEAVVTHAQQAAYKGDGALSQALGEVVLMSAKQGDVQPLRQVLQLATTSAEPTPVLKGLVDVATTAVGGRRLGDLTALLQVSKNIGGETLQGVATQLASAVEGLSPGQQKWVMATVLQTGFPAGAGEIDSKAISQLLTEVFQTAPPSEKSQVMRSVLQIADHLPSSTRVRLASVLTAVSKPEAAAVLKQFANIVSSLSPDTAHQLTTVMSEIPPKVVPAVAASLQQLSQSLDDGLFQRVMTQVVALPPADRADMLQDVLPRLATIEPEVLTMLLRSLDQTSSMELPMMASVIGQLSDSLEMPVLRAVLTMVSSLPVGEQGEILSNLATLSDGVGGPVLQPIVAQLAQQSAELLSTGLQHLAVIDAHLSEPVIREFLTALPSHSKGEPGTTLSQVSTLAKAIDRPHFEAMVGRLTQIGPEQMSTVVTQLSALAGSLRGASLGMTFEQLSQLPKGQFQGAVGQLSQLAQALDSATRHQVSRLYSSMNPAQLSTLLTRFGQLLDTAGPSLTKLLVPLVSTAKPELALRLTDQLSFLASKLGASVLNTMLTSLKTTSPEQFARSLEGLAALSKVVDRGQLNTLLGQLARLNPELASAVLSELAQLLGPLDAKSMQQLILILNQLLASKDSVLMQRLGVLLMSLVEQGSRDNKAMQRLLAILAQGSGSKGSDLKALASPDPEKLGSFLMNLGQEIPAITLKNLPSALGQSNSMAEVMSATVGALDDLQKRRLTGSSATQMRGTLVKRDAVSQLLMAIMGIRLSDLADDTSGGMLDWQEWLKKTRG